jgi:hypothetical protein
MIAPIEAYPLTWPPGRPRDPVRGQAPFRTQLGAAISEVKREVELLGGRDLVISSNLPLRRDGMPYAKAPGFMDPAVAVYFTYTKKPMCFACDYWNRIEDNMHAIGLTIGALRGIKRWGSGDMMQQAFTGFIALPAPEQPFQVLGVSATATREEIETAYKRLAMQHHPDRGGDSSQMARINSARDSLLENRT